MDTCDEARAETITQSITEFIVGCAVAFTTAESSFFIDMLKSLNAACIKHLPKADFFRRTHLPESFDDTVKEINGMWKDVGNPWLTLGHDGHANDNDISVLIVTETVEDKTAFKKCMDPKEESENGDWPAKQALEEMEKVAKGPNPKKVDDAHVGAVCDNVSCNRTAGRIIEQKHPKLLAPGCCTHVGDLSMEDVAKTDETKKVVADCRTAAAFVKSCRTVPNARKRIIEQNRGTMLPPCPDTRFGCSDPTMQQVEKNMQNLRALVDEDDYESNTVRTAPIAKKDKPKGLVNDANFVEKMEAVRGITGPLCKLVHHFEKGMVRASWVHPMFVALLKDYDEWRVKNKKTMRHLSFSTMQAVGAAVVGRWNGVNFQGHDDSVPFKNDTWSVARVLDPCHACGLDGDAHDTRLGVDCVASLRKLLPKFFDGQELENAVNEVCESVLHRGGWGDETKRCQQTVKVPDGKTFGSSVERVIWQQDQMTSTRSA